MRKETIIIAQEILEITSDIAELPRVRAFLREFCLQKASPGFSEDRFSELELAVNEATTNIMKHAYNNEPDHYICVETVSDTEAVTVRLLHEGSDFQPDEVPPPSFDGSRDNGFGVFLIDQCVDEVKYIKDEQGRNCTFMLKRYVPSDESGHKKIVV